MIPMMAFHPRLSAVLLAAFIITSSLALNMAIFSGEASITGDPPPTGGDWLVQNNTLIENELSADIAGNTTVINTTLNITGSTVFFQGDVRLGENAILDAYDSDITFNGSLNIADSAQMLSSRSTLHFVGNNTLLTSEGSITLEHTDIGCPAHTLWNMIIFSGEFNASDCNITIGWEFNFANGSRMKIENTHILFRNNTYSPSCLMGVQGQTAFLDDVIFDVEEGQHYLFEVLDTGYPAKIEMNRCEFNNGGIPYNSTGGLLYIPETTVYSNSSSFLMENCTFLNDTGGALTFAPSMAYPYQTSVVRDTNISGEGERTHGIGCYNSLIDVSRCTIEGAQMGIVFMESPGIDVLDLSDPSILISRIRNNVLRDNEWGVYLYRGVADISDNDLGGSVEYGILGNNSRLHQDTTGSNDLSGLGANCTPILFESHIQCIVYRGDGTPQSNSQIYIPETGREPLSTNLQGSIYLNDPTGLLAYKMDRDGSETYGRYTINASYDTGVYTSYNEFVLEPLNMSYLDQPIHIYLDAGPDLKINYIRPSTTTVPSGGTIEVVVNVTNNWWYPVENVTFLAQTDMTETIMNATIPANTTTDVIILLPVGTRQEDCHIEIYVSVDPETAFEGARIDLHNNHFSTPVDILSEPEGEVPLTGLVVAIAVLLVVFLFSLYRAFASKEEEDGEGWGKEEGEESGSEGENGEEKGKEREEGSEEKGGEEKEKPKGGGDRTEPEVEQQVVEKREPGEPPAEGTELEVTEETQTANETRENLSPP